MDNIKRELYNKQFVIGKLLPDAEIWDLDLNSCTVEDFPTVMNMIKANNVVFSYIKGSKVTMFTSNYPGAPKYQALLDTLGIAIKVGPKAAKRLARFFSDRDAVVTMAASEVNIEVVRGNEFTPLEFSEEDNDALLDGMIAVSKSFAIKLLKRAGVDVSVLRDAEALSFSAVTPQGFLKALAYIVEDEDMCVTGADIVTNSANIKEELVMVIDEMIFAVDVFRPYADPKTNIQTDIMLREILGNQELDVKLLVDTLASDRARIISGEAVKAMHEWNMPQLEQKIGSTKVNADFAALSDMAADMHARGLDYRWFPGLVSMIGTGRSNQWYNLKGGWSKYPLPCAWSRPVISASGSYLIGEGIDVERGDIRAIRHGEIWVVNDEDYIEFFRINCGGGDLDDHFMLIFRMIDGVRKVIVGRIPMGWREFSVFNFTDGDPFPTYISAKGTETSFPPIPGSVPKTLFEMQRDGEMRVTGLPRFESVKYPTTYTPDAVVPIVSELLSGEAGFVGAIINAVMVAAATKAELLNAMPTTMEGIIDSFTQGGGIKVREFLTKYGQSLLEKLDVKGVEIDSKFSGSRVGGKKFRRARIVNGLYWKRDAENKTIRKQFVKEINEFAQAYNRNGNPLLDKMLKAFDMQYWDVQNTEKKLFVEIRRAQKAFNGHILTMQEINTSAARAFAEATGKPYQHINISSEQWDEIFNSHLERLNKIANNDPEALKVVVLVNWMVCMVVRTRGEIITDRSIINKVMWPIFVQALVEFGFAMDLNKLVMGANPWNEVETITCTSCGVTGSARVAARLRFAFSGGRCKACR